MHEIAYWSYFTLDYVKQNDLNDKYVVVMTEWKDEVGQNIEVSRWFVTL